MLAVKARILRKSLYLQPSDWKVAQLAEITLHLCGDDYYDQASHLKKEAVKDEPTQVRVLRALIGVETVVEYFTEVL